MIWLLILQGYARFMDKYHELVREQYVNFEGQKTLYIEIKYFLTNYFLSIFFSHNLLIKLKFV